jgi:hypothetical protein
MLRVHRLAAALQYCTTAYAPPRGFPTIHVGSRPQTGRILQFQRQITPPTPPSATCLHRKRQTRRTSYPKLSLARRNGERASPHEPLPFPAPLRITLFIIARVQLLIAAYGIRSMAIRTRIFVELHYRGPATHKRRFASRGVLSGGGPPACCVPTQRIQGEIRALVREG